MLVRIWHGAQVVSEYQAPVDGPMVSVDPWAKTITVGEKTLTFDEVTGVDDE